MPISLTAASYNRGISAGTLTIATQYTIAVSSTLSFDTQEVIQYPCQPIVLAVPAFTAPIVSASSPSAIVHAISPPIFFKSRLIYQQYAYVFVPNLLIDSLESRWHQGWSEPIRITFRRGIRARFQQAYTAPARYLPPPNVTMTMVAPESASADAAEFDIFSGEDVPPIDQTAVYVSIEEIPAQSGGHASMTETD